MVCGRHAFFRREQLGRAHARRGAQRRRVESSDQQNERRLIVCSIHVWCSESASIVLTPQVMSTKLFLSGVCVFVRPRSVSHGTVFFDPRCSRAYVQKLFQSVWHRFFGLSVVARPSPWQSPSPRAPFTDAHPSWAAFLSWALRRCIPRFVFRTSGLAALCSPMARQIFLQFGCILLTSGCTFSHGLKFRMLQLPFGGALPQGTRRTPSGCCWGSCATSNSAHCFRVPCICRSRPPLSN